MEKSNLDDAEKKLSKKEFLIKELKDLGSIMGYLFVSLSVMETYKSLILLQLGIHAFQHNYLFALIEAIALGKIVALTQNLSLLKQFSGNSLYITVLIQAVIMTLITDVGGYLEDLIFPHAAQMLARTGNPLALTITHQWAAMLIFIVLFAFRGLDKRLGKGTLGKLFFAKPEAV